MHLCGVESLPGSPGPLTRRTALSGYLLSPADAAHSITLNLGS